MTTLEFHDFQATHNGARIRGNGRKDPTPGGGILVLNLDAESLALDSDLRDALAAIDWTIRGRRSSRRAGSIARHG